MESPSEWLPLRCIPSATSLASFASTVLFALMIACTGTPTSRAALAAEVIEDGAQWYVSTAGTNQGIHALKVAPLTWMNGY